MANVNRANGFRLVKSASGAPLTGLIRTVGVASGANIFVGDSISLSSGLAAPSATNDATFMGVAVGFGKKDAFSLIAPGPYSADNLMKRYFDNSAYTNTDWVCYYVPAIDGIFEVQTATALTLKVGDTADLSAGAGSTTTGISGHQITTSANADVQVVEIPSLPDNDPTLIYGRYWVRFTRANTEFLV